MISKPGQRTRLRKVLCCLAVTLTATCTSAIFAAAQSEHSPAQAHEIKADQAQTPELNALKYLGAALAIGLAALATGIAQARIGAAGVGAIAENPKRLGAIIMLIAIPETVAILGFVIAYLMIS